MHATADSCDFRGGASAANAVLLGARLYCERREEQEGDKSLLNVLERNTTVTRTNLQEGRMYAPLSLTRPRKG